jgi:hypothetical protein
VRQPRRQVTTGTPEEGGDFRPAALASVGGDDRGSQQTIRVSRRDRPALIANHDQRLRAEPVGWTRWLCMKRIALAEVALLALGLQIVVYRLTAFRPRNNVIYMQLNARLCKRACTT